MLLKSETNKNNYKEESDVARITDEANIDSTRSQNQSPKSLLDMTAVLAQDSDLSSMLVQNGGFENPHITAGLTKITPFIHLLPEEIKCVLLTLLPIKDWKSLFHVSKEWQHVVMTAARFFLNNIMRDNLPLISLDKILKNLLIQVEGYSQRPNARNELVQKLKQLETEVGCLTTPLEKLIHYQKVIDEVQKNIESAYKKYNRSSFYFSFFPTITPRNSKLYLILESFNSQQLFESSWFKKIKYCANLCPDHAIAIQLSEIFLAIEDLKSSKKEMTQNLML